MLDPDDRDHRLELAISVTSTRTSGSVRPPAISSSSSTLGRDGQRLGQLQPLAVEQRQPAGQGTSGASPTWPDRPTPSTSRPASPASPAPNVLATSTFSNTVRGGKGLRDLVGANDPEPGAGRVADRGDVASAQADAPGIGRHRAVEHVEHEALAGAVRADHAEAVTRASENATSSATTIPPYAFADPRPR